MRNVRLPLAFGVLLLASGALAESLTVNSTYTKTLKGGVAMDGWGESSTETSFASGSLQIQLPAGAVVEEAVLVSATTNIPTGPNMPPGPDGFPRVVILGTGGAATTRTLEGAPDHVVAGSATFGSWVTNVTATVKDAIGATASGAVVPIAISERGDGVPDEFKIAGHTLIVVYSHPSAPLRNVMVALGAAGTTFFNGSSSSTLSLPSAYLACGEPAVLSISDVWEFNVWTEQSVIAVNGNQISSTAGGCDDFPSVAPGTGQGGATGGLITVGSFGGGGAGMVGSPLGLKGDSVSGLPSLPRLDDELYDIQSVLSDGATTITLGLTNTTDAEFLSAAVVQTLARVAPNDADGDGLLDSLEAACPTDSDSDGTPNLLDPDSDNDCLGDATDAAPTIPSGPSLLNCPSHASPICSGTGVVPTCGPCATTAQCTQRDATHPVCNAGACVAGPVITAPANNATFTGPVSGGGTGPASTNVTLFGKLETDLDYLPLGTIPVNGSGNYSYGPVVLPPGTYQIFVRSTVGGSNTDSPVITFTVLPNFDMALPTFDLSSPPTFDLTPPETFDLKPPTFDLTAPVIVDLKPPTFDLTSPVVVDLKPPTFDLTAPPSADLTAPPSGDLKVASADLTPPEGADLGTKPPVDQGGGGEGDLGTKPPTDQGTVVADLRSVVDFARAEDLTASPDLQPAYQGWVINGGGFNCSTPGTPASSAASGMLLFAALLLARSLRKRV